MVPTLDRIAPPLVYLGRALFASSTGAQSIVREKLRSAADSIPRGKPDEERAVQILHALADAIAIGPKAAAPRARREVRDRLLQAGALLSNAAFNIAQRAGEVLSERDAATLKQCQREWDAARRAFKEEEYKWEQQSIGGGS